MDDPCCEWPVLCRLASELRKKLQWREQKPRYVQSAGQHHHTRSTHSCPMHGSDALVYQHLRGRFGMHASRSYVWSVPVAHGTGGGQGGERARGVRRTTQGGGPGTSKGGGARGSRGACPSAHYQLIISSLSAHYQLMHTTGGLQEAVVPHFFYISFPPCASVDQLTVLYAACGIGACVQGGQGAGACGGQGGGGGGEAGKETGGAERGARASQAGARAALRAG